MDPPICLTSLVTYKLRDLAAEVEWYLLAQRPITLILIMINSCSYSINDLLLIKFQIFDQDLSRCLASTKNLKLSFKASMH